MVNLFKVNNLCTFYAWQYEMIFDIKDDPCFMVLKGRITFKNVVTKFDIFYDGLSDNAILQQVHGIIYDVLAKAGRSENND